MGKINIKKRTVEAVGDRVRREIRKMGRISSSKTMVGKKNEKIRKQDRGQETMARKSE
jgi:hypothetical protein